MNKVVVSFLGQDRPGIMHIVTKALSELSLNILEVSQTILRSEFAAIVIADLPNGSEGAGSLDLEELRRRLEADPGTADLTVSAKEFRETTRPAPGEPFVITVSGLDRLGIIALMTGVIARNAVNILSLTAISRQDAPGSVVIVFEVEVPESVDLAGFRRDLSAQGRDIGMDVTFQHRDIFEAIHRI